MVKFSQWGLSLLSAVGCCLFSAVAAETDGVAAAPEKEAVVAPAQQETAAVSGAVGEAMLKLRDKVLTEVKPATDAEFYVYLISASWCGPCNQEMPGIVEAYERMRKDKRVELILLSGDSTPEAAKGFVEKYGGTFPVVPESEGVNVLPGYVHTSRVPHCFFVDKDGKVLRKGHGYLVQHWEKFTIAPPESGAELP